MSQKISAFYYIKNNKRRVSVLIISLAMFFIITYTSMFLLSTTSETFKAVLVENGKYIQYIVFGGDDLELDKSSPQADSEDIYREAVNKKYGEIKNSIKQCKGVEDVFIAQVEYTYVASVVGNYYVEIPMTDREHMEVLLKHMDAKLVEGRMPAKAKEAVMDRKLMKNYGYKLGDGLSQNKDVKIVGIIDCDYYFGCGLSGGSSTFSNPMVCVATDGTVKNLESAIKEQDVLLENSTFMDLEKGENDLENNIISVISSSTRVIFNGILIIITLLVIIVSISYMRDRRSEWCLYASIGYSRKAIYFSILRELLFTFITAFLAAAVITIILMKVSDILLIKELGLRCTYFISDTLIEILCAYTALFGILQIPVRMEIYKIKTIDAIDDDM